MGHGLNKYERPNMEVGRTLGSFIAVRATAVRRMVFRWIRGARALTCLVSGVDKRNDNEKSGFDHVYAGRTTGLSCG
ncbi:hypothetical protein ACLOJK_016252 [Asimina triloba]